MHARQSLLDQSDCGIFSSVQKHGTNETAALVHSIEFDFDVALHVPVSGKGRSFRTIWF